MYSREQIIKKAKNVHGEKYSYENIGDNPKINGIVEIICPRHGIFRQTLHAHINKKQGCPQCAVEQRSIGKRYNTDLFIQKANSVHGDKYDYSKVTYKDSMTKICIICPIHGEFWQRPDMHLNGRGCKRCAEIEKHKKRRITANEFIEQCSKLYENKYVYENIAFESLSDKIKIKCPIHGYFEKKVYEHLDGQGCPKCSAENNAVRHKMNTNDFIEKSKKIHGLRYNYDKTVYNGCSDYVTIICPKHGEFKQIASYHLSGNGCPKCGVSFSKGEEELFEFVKQCMEDETVEHNNRNIIDGLELDVWIPSKQIAFEFNGLYWHSEMCVENDYHIKKKEECKKKGIRLIHIFEDEWNGKKEICKSRIENILSNTQNKIFARKCQIKTVNFKECRTFLNENHIQGYIPSKYNYGLYYNEELVSIMTFGNIRKNLGNKSKSGTFELLRFCNKLHHSVVGGASRLFKYFINEHHPETIITYADKRWSDGNLYDRLGFTFSHTSRPSYFYLIKGKRVNRFSLRKDVLISKYGCTKEETEHSFCLKNKWYRIYDCGTNVYVWDNNEKKLYI